MSDDIFAENEEIKSDTLPLPKKKDNVLEFINYLSIASQGSEDIDEFVANHKIPLKKIASFLGLESKTQSLLFAILFEQTFLKHSVAISQICDHLTIPPLKFASYLEDLEMLKNKRLISNTGYGNRRNNVNSWSFEIPQKIINRIIKNSPIQTGNSQLQNTEDFVQKVFEVIDETDEQSDYLNLIENVIALFNNNEHLFFVKKVIELKLNIEERMIICMLFFKQIIDNVGLNFHDLTKKLTSNTNGMIHLKNSIIYGKSTLVRDNLIEIADGLFDDSKEIKLTQNAIDVFSENNIHDGKKIMTNKPRELISYESLKVNPLVHNPAEKQQIQQLESILQEENYNHLISKLQEKNYYTCGITVIFSGLAGTSKTMSCLTLAKNTRRDVFFVDISTVRSMWFGQSEKQLKALFQTYRRLVDESERAPIMFIDEADSLISKRVSVERTLDLTSNTLQNILLLEIQNLKGILIAASNLIGINNVDPAYERRFLFKVKFEKPGYVERKAIWTLNIPQLPNQQIEKLANEFNSFSGAEIENCSKRFILQETLQNKQPTFQELIDMCNQERFQSSEKSGKIGY